MKKRIQAYLFLFFIGSLIHVYHNYIPLWMLKGTYVNTNYEYGHFIAEIPYGQDSLTLHADKTFSSTYWGEGQYEISYSLYGTKLHLPYNEKLRVSGLNTTIKRRFFSSARIILVDDRYHYMRKIKD
ncbi:MAG: hypothetical protein AAF696_30035 [Bacteroidota bacterium]